MDWARYEFGLGHLLQILFALVMHFEVRWLDTMIEKNYRSDDTCFSFATLFSARARLVHIP
jgi:hypothetical protein